MRKLAIAMALASTALASPAIARDGQWYVGLEGGPMIVEDPDFDINGVDNAATLDHDYGYDFDGIVGYDFGAFRLEAEVGYRAADPEQIRAGAPGVPDGASPGAVTGTFDTAGDTSALSFMVNGMLDFGDDDGVQGFVGGGAGVSRVKIKNVIGAPNWLDDSDTGFAWQAIAGIRAPISKSVDVGLKYRFFNVDDVNLIDRLGRTVDTRLRTHSLLGSITFNFGGAEEPPVVEETTPPPVVEETTPPPPVTQAPPPCQTGPYIVFFDWDQSNLRPDAATVLDNAVAQYANCGSARVMLAGHADRSGTATYNVGLSERRNTTVSEYLQSRGIPGGVISSEAFGESQPRVATADGVREPQNRRVEITYGPGAGY